MESFAIKLKTFGYIITIPFIVSLAIYFYNEKIELLKSENAIMKERLENQKLLQCDNLLSVLKAKEDLFTRQKKQLQFDMDEAIKEHKHFQKKLKSDHVFQVLNLLASVKQLNAQINDLNEIKEELNIPDEIEELSDQDLKTFTRIFHYIKNNYIEAVSDEVLLNGAIRGIQGKIEIE